MYLLETLEKKGYQHIIDIPHHGLCGILRFIYTVGLVTGLNDTGYSSRYCYSSYQDAVKALSLWNGMGDPSGPWIKYKGYDGERTNPNSDEL